uniref:PH domain-containing protein n=1 Tax=Odontella aurita TaxID=265563 RepID=A0A7S4JDK0_9STRA|mmetsp:Transcript_44370/g.135233  ORF Transcript_44370/g.135233 Transcript_44370/m.135233 type:complete len:493 (+) Transcript_44370:224-1702(+)
MASSHEVNMHYQIVAPPSLRAAAGGGGDSSRGIFLPLVVDELDAGSALICSPASADPSRIRGSDRVKPSGSTRNILKSIQNIGPLEQHAATVSGTHACPCCRRYVLTASPLSVAQQQFPDDSSDEGAGKASRASPDSVASQDRERESESGSKSGSPLRLVGALSGTFRLSGSFDSADKLSYDISEIIARGWVHKKGTGKDWLGSRSWKPRWAVLATASVPGYDVDVPLLLVYWYSSSESPSNVIVLDETVVMPVDRYKSEKKVVEWNTYSFEVAPVSKKSGGGGGQSPGGSSNEKDDQENRRTRTFSVPEKERNEWVFNINKTMMEYEKRLTKFRNDRAAKEAIQQQQLRRSPSSATNSRAAGDGEVHPYDEQRAPGPASPGRTSRGRPMSPPLSPRAGFGPGSLKPPMSPRSSPPGRGMLKPPLSPRSSPRQQESMRSMKCLKPLSPRAAGRVTGRGLSGSSLSYSMTSIAGLGLDESSLAGLNIALPEAD